MNKTLKNVKLWETTLYYTKLLAALHGVSMIQLIHNLIVKELEEHGKEIDTSKYSV